MKKILLLILVLPVIVQAADTEVQNMPAMIAITSTDVLYIVDDPAGTPASEKITALDLFDMIKTFALLDAIVTDKSLANLDDAMTWVALGTFNLGITITTGDPFYLGAIRWDDGSDRIDGEQIADNTIDVDSLDWGAFTDLGEGGAVTWGNILAGELTDDSVNNADINWGDIDNLGDEGTITVADTADATSYVALWESATGDLAAKSDAALLYAADTGTLAATEFSGGGASLTGTVTAWDDIADSDAATTTSMASNDHTFSNVADYTWTSGTTAEPDLFIINTNDDATAGSLTLRKAGSSPTPADGDYLGTINFDGDDSGGNNETYVRLIGQSKEVNNTDEAGEFHIMVMFDDGTPALDEMFSIYGDITGPGTGKFIWNQDGQDMDYRMETDSEDHFLYIDGGANWMRLGDWDTNYVQTTSAGVITFVGTGDIDLPDDSVDDDDINWTDLTYLTTNGAGIDEAFGAGWNGDVGPAEKDDIYDILHAYDTDDDGDIDTIDGSIAALLYETELDDFSELDTQIADKSLVNFEDGGTFTGNIIANANLSVGNAGTTAGVLTILEDDDDGANFASFTVPALANNTVYILPPDDGDNTEVLQTNGSGTLTWVANAGGGATAWDDISDPDNSGLITITFDNTEATLFTGDNDAAVSFITIQNSDADHTGGNMYLLDLDYSADDGDVDADFIKFQDSGSVVMTIQQNGDITTDGGLVAGGAITENGNAVISEAVATAGLIFGDSTPDADGEIAFDTTGDGSTVMAGVLDIHDGTEVVHYFGSAGYPTGDNQIQKYDAGTNKIVWEADASAGTTAWDDIADPDAAATVDFTTYTQTIDIGVTDDGGPKSGLILDVTGLGAGTTDVIALEITTAADWDTDFVPIAIYNNSGSDNDLVFMINNEGMISLRYGGTFYQTSDNYINFYDNSDEISFYFGGADCDIIWSDGALNLRNDENGTDGIVNIQGKDGGEKGILRVLSDGDDKHIELHHDDTDAHIISNSGDIHIEANGGDINFADDNIVTTGNINGAAIVTAGTDPDVDAVGEIGRDTDDHSLRGFDGSAQYLYATRDKPKQFTITEPDQLAEADHLVVWTNNTAFTFHITEIQARADTDDATFTIKEVDADGANVTIIEAVTISTNGTNLFYTTVAVGDIDHKVIEAGHLIMYDASAFDTNYIHVAIEGYFDADVN